MRILEGRGDWRPGFRIEGLRRYAFIGDSHAYGVGVAPNQTLSANAERQMNELLPGWPVEAVNLGVCGYNLWNSWFAFRHAPQVYDGVVLALCDNDADLFGRSYRVEYAEPHHTRWESPHPFGESVARCFDDIASFSQEKSLPAAVVYYNAFDERGALRIGEIIGALCAARGLLFIDTFALYRDRRFKHNDLVVSSADGHPSAMAHEAVGRHLAATLKRQGWFGEYDASAISAAPDRILAAARAMVETDHYPPDAALNWARGALDAKSRVAHRLQASGAVDDFSIAAARASEAMTTASRRWHMINRTRALAQDTATAAYGIGWRLFHLQEEKLKLEELGFALGTGDWSRLTARLPDAGQTQQIVPDTWSSDAAGFLDGCRLDLLHLRQTLDALRIPPVEAVFGAIQDEGLMLADLKALARVADLAQTECAEMRASILRLEGIFPDAHRSLTEAQITHISKLISAALKNVKESLGFVPRLGTAIGHIRDADDAALTTVEVTVSSQAAETRQVCSLSGQVDYSVPKRLPCRDQGNFLRDGSATLIKLYFPVFCAGRIGLRIFNPKAANRPTVEGTIVKVELYNGKNQRLTVAPASFQEQSGRLISPPIYLP